MTNVGLTAASEKTRLAAQTEDPRMAAFDYGTQAELFPTRSRKTRRQPVGYKRFSRAADAIRFAIEDLPPEFLVGAYLEVDEERFDGDGIRRLYDSTQYPLVRRAVTDEPAKRPETSQLRHPRQGAPLAPGAAT